MGGGSPKETFTILLLLLLLILKTGEGIAFDGGSIGGGEGCFHTGMKRINTPARWRTINVVARTASSRRSTHPRPSYPPTDLLSRCHRRRTHAFLLFTLRPAGPSSPRPPTSSSPHAERPCPPTATTTELCYVTFRCVTRCTYYWLQLLYYGLELYLVFISHHIFLSHVGIRSISYRSFITQFGQRIIINRPAELGLLKNY